MRFKFLIGFITLMISGHLYAAPISLINESHLALTLVTFFMAGILLAFTPCVLPMVPILSAILVGQQETNTKRAFYLSSTFVISMAFTYAIAGMLAGYLGSTLQTLMQTPFIIVTFSLIFVLMALSMFGLFNLSMPTVLQSRIQYLNNRLTSGSYIGVALMGVLSTLIASPCVTAPLISVLTYISQTGSAIKGGLILFVLALGMGLPLILFGTGQAALLPKTGDWMNKVKGFFGVLMLALAIWMSSRILPGSVSLLLWASLLIVSSVAFGALNFDATKRLPGVLQGVAILALTYGIILLVGASDGHENPLNPLQANNEVNTSGPTIRPASALFQYATSLTALNDKLAIAKKAHKPVMIEFFANWCPDCKQVDREVLSDINVQKHVRAITAIRIDVSERNPVLAKIMEKYKVVGVPTVILYDADGKQVDATALNSDMNKDNLVKTLEQLSA